MTSINSVEELGEMGEEELEELYTWVDSIPLSRPKRNLARDFSDGMLVAELIKHMFPKLIDVHNYPPASNSKQKMQNWNLLNTKVFRKLHFELSPEVMQQITAAKPGVMERILSMLRTRLERVQWDTKTRQRIKMSENERPEVDQCSAGRVSSLRDINTTSGSGGGAAFAPTTAPKSIRFPQDETVPAILLEGKQQELLMKDETIQILQAKIKRLEHLQHLKDARIEELQKRQESTRMTSKR